MHALVKTVAVLVAVAPAYTVAQAEKSRRAVPLDELKRIYLGCSSASLGGRLGTQGIAQCSVVYEALKNRAFGGDFEKLLAWSRSQPSSVPVASPRDAACVVAASPPQTRRADTPTPSPPRRHAGTTLDGACPVRGAGAVSRVEDARRAPPAAKSAATNEWEHHDEPPPVDAH
jgi:hypothetical protein